MLRWFLKRMRKFKRAWSSRFLATPPAVVGGEVTVAALHPSGESTSPVFETTIRPGTAYRGMADVEIRGFLDGEVKFERNVATQYHVRIGCEGSKPLKGRYEVMRLLQRWDLSALPRFAQVLDARLVLRQEDTSAFPHRYPLRWPVDFYLYEVKRPWGPGRGGVEADNQSIPERGDAWWIDARAGEVPWKQPGCGYASDTDPDADRGAEALARARLRSAGEALVFTGPRLARHVESVLSRDGTLDVIVKAGTADEQLPGSVKTFFSAEYGDDLTPTLRPSLAVRWRARCLAHETRPFVLEPGTELSFVPSFRGALADGAETILAAAVGPSTPAPESDGPRAPAPGDAVSDEPVLVPEVFAVKDGSGDEGDGPTARTPLQLPAKCSGPGMRILVSAAVHPVRLGEQITVRLLETWAPSVASPEALDVSFRMTAPSGRIADVRARHEGSFLYAATFRPDELGIWAYSWRTRPDPRFQEQRGAGVFTVVRPRGGRAIPGFRDLVDAACSDAVSQRGILARRRNHFRLVTLQRELRNALTEEQVAGPSSDRVYEIRELLRRVAATLPRVE